MKPLIRILIIEDHLGYRQVLERAINRQKNLKLINQFGTAEIALRFLKTATSDEVPNVILLDLNLPGMSGLDTIPFLKKYVSEAKIMILTQSDNKEDILRAISLGADGYLLKSATVNVISEGIHTVMNGGASLDASVANFVLKTIQRLPSQLKDKPEKSLSERELEVLELLAKGLVKKEIADQLGISITTVASHVRSIYEKFHVQNAPAAVSKAYRLGIFLPGK